MLSILPRNKKLNRNLILLGVLVLLLIGAGVFWLWQKRQQESYLVGIILSKAEFDPEDMEIIKFTVRKKLESINKSGGINNRPVTAIYLEDNQDLNILYQQVNQISQDPNLIAFIGSKGSSRALKIIPLLAQRKIPFIGRYTLTHLFRNYPNAYSSEMDYKDLSALYQHILKNNSRRGAFIGIKGDLYSQALLKLMENLAPQSPDFKVTLRKFYPINYKLSQQEIETLTDSLKNKADFLVMVSEAKYFNYLIKLLWKKGVNIPLYCGTADLMQLETTNPGFISGEFFHLNAYGLPGVQNMRLYDHLTDYPNKLKPGSKIEFQLGTAGRLADELGLLQEASKDIELPKSLSIREKIILGLRKYVNGNKVYRGWFSDWSFTEDHGYAGNALIAWKPRNSRLPLLAPLQFYHTDSTDLMIPGLPVLYTNLNLQELKVNYSESNSFDANFFLQLTSVQDIKIDQLEFVNASRNKINREPLISIKLIRSFQESLPQRFYNYIYKVSGKFIFDQDMKRYPFDEQKFPIKITAKNALKPFLIQPPEISLRDTLFKTTGWIYQDSYVGYEQDLIYAGDNFSSLQNNITGYNFSFVYILKRAKVDFTLKTVVPLMALLLMSYFSVFIPPQEFEALAGIQVTALLSAIALYFSTYKPVMEYAAISDKIFVFTYIMITSLIGTSIYLYKRHNQQNVFSRSASFYQRIIFPAILVAFTIAIQS